MPEKIDSTKLNNKEFIYIGRFLLSSSSSYEDLNQKLAGAVPFLRIGPPLNLTTGEYEPPSKKAYGPSVGLYRYETAKSHVNCIVDGQRITLEDAILKQESVCDFGNM